MRKILLFSTLCLFGLQAYSIDEYCLENDAVHHFLTDFTYSSDDYSYTKITDYCDPVPYQYYKATNRYGRNRKDQPKPVTLKGWNPIDDAVSQSIELSEDETFSNSVFYTVAKNASSYDIYNLIPGRRYYYKIWAVKGDGSKDMIKSDAFYTTGTLRMLKIDGIFNVRDLGGWTGLGGNKLAYGKIFRGSRMSNNGSSNPIISTEGIKAMLAAGIKADLDLRTDSEAPLSKSPLASSLDQDIDYKRIPDAYKSRVSTFDQSSSSIDAVQWIINELKKNRPVYFHCSVGADRTETVAFFIGALCGMDENSLAKEFELTSFSADSIMTGGKMEDLRRRRTYDGRFDTEEEDYKYAKMIDKVKALPGGNIQRKIYNYLLNGKNGKSISAEDLAWLVKEMTGYSLLSSVDVDVDELTLAKGETYQLQLNIMPADAQVSEIIYKTSSSQIATVSNDGVVTAVSGGKALITVSVDGINKNIPIYVPITPESVSNLCLENELVHKYMTEVKYDANDYTVSYIEKYDTVKTDYEKDWPQVARIEWNMDPDVVQQVLTISADSAFNKTAFETETNVKSGYWNVWNLNPQQLYYFKLTSSYSDMSNFESLSSAFMSTGTVKMIRADGTYNVRDFGGWTGLDGRKVKYGMLVRGARLKNNKDNTENSGMVMISSDGIDILYKKLGLNAEIDLRSDEETENSKSALSARSAKFLRIADANTCLGDKILDGDAYIRALNQIIEWLKVGRKVYVSSSLGADRAGTVAFLVNGLLGVDEESLSKDYELSSFSEDVLEDVIRKRTDSQYVGMVNKIKTLEGETLQKKIYNYFKTGINGTAVSTEDLDWFIKVMLEKESSVTGVVASEKVARQDNRIYNLFGQEVLNPGKGIYIMNGKKFIVK